jgi:hypothetical protein
MRWTPHPHFLSRPSFAHCFNATFRNALFCKPLARADAAPHPDPLPVRTEGALRGEGDQRNYPEAPPCPIPALNPRSSSPAPR